MSIYDAKEMFEEAMEGGHLPTREECIALMDCLDIAPSSFRSDGDDILSGYGYDKPPATLTWAAYARRFLSIRKGLTARSKVGSAAPDER